MPSGVSSAAERGAPPARPAPPGLLEAPAVVVAEQSNFLSAGGYDLLTTQEEPLGSVRMQSSVGGFLFGGAAETRYQVLDVRGQLVGSVVRPGSFGSRSRFTVHDASGAAVGTIEQENTFMAPRLRLTTTDGLVLRLLGGQFGSGEWQLVDGVDESVLMGLLHRQFAGIGGMLGGRDRFMIELSPQLTGGHRLLALMATICLDYVKDQKDRRSTQ